MKLTKMHGLGNDFILANNLDGIITNHSELAKKVCDRNFGIGADGLITVEQPSSPEYKFRMRIMNSDGSEAEMCGNGIRCFAKYLFDATISLGGAMSEDGIAIQTLAGKITPKIVKYDEGDTTALVEVDMGVPRLKASEIPTTLASPDSEVVDVPYLLDQSVGRMTAVSMGNPHVVILSLLKTDADLDNLVQLYGAKIERDTKTFPKKTNVEFVNVNDREDITMRVYERGCGPTLACGTGACASVVAGVLNNKTERDVLVHLLGGDLKIRWDEKNNHIYMTGPAQTVFSTDNYKI